MARVMLARARARFGVLAGVAAVAFLLSAFLAVVLGILVSAPTAAARDAVAAADEVTGKLLSDALEFDYAKPAEKPDCRWRERAERERMLTRVAEDAERALQAVEQAEGLLSDQAVKEAHDLLRELIGQDFDVDEDGIPRLLDDSLPGIEAKRREIDGWLEKAKRENWYREDDEIDAELPHVGWDDPVWRSNEHSFGQLLEHYVRPGMRVLEVGAARCWAAQHLLPRGCVYVGTDILADPVIGLGRGAFYAERVGEFGRAAAREYAHRFGMEIGPGAGRRVIGREVQHDAGVAAIARGEGLALAAHHRVAVGGGVHAPVQAHAEGDVVRIRRQIRAAHDVTEHAAGERGAGTIGQPEMGEEIHPRIVARLTSWAEIRMTLRCPWTTTSG